MFKRRQRSLVFFHIAKCGGTSATSALRSVFRDAASTSGGNLDAEVLGSRPGAADVLFHGHAQHGAALHVPAGAVTATLLRAPADRAISHYCHSLRDDRLPLHGMARELGFEGLLRAHWQVLVFQAISLSVAISAGPIQTPEMFFQSLPAARRFLRRIDVVGHLDHLGAFLDAAARRTGRAPPPPPGRHNATDPVLEGVDVPKLRREFDALADDPLLRSLMAAEASVAAYALRRSIVGPRFWRGR